MYKKKIDYKKIIIEFGIIIAFIFLIAFIVEHKDRKLTFIEKSIKDFTLLGVRTLKMPFYFIKDKTDDNELSKLKRKAMLVDSIEAKYEEATKEINELKELVNLNSTLSEHSYLNATVISRNVGYFNDNLIIDKGTKNGLEKGMAVITSKGLIGSISSTSSFNSTVKLITSQDTNDKISVKIEAGDDYVYGLLVGYNEKKNRFIIEGISENIEIKKDAKVTTTGLGNSFPSGILVGKVDSISKDHFELSSIVEVESMEKFSGFGYVTVLKKEAIK